MTEFKTSLANFFICFNFFFRKTVFRPAIFIAGIVIPLLWTTAICFIVDSSTSPSYRNGPKDLSFPVVMVPGTLFFGTCFFSIMSLPSNLALDRIHKRLKIYLTLGVSQNVYLSSNVFGLFTVYLPTFLAQLLIVNSVLKIHLSSCLLFSIIGINLIVFFLMCLQGIFISTLSKSDKSSHVFNTLMIVTNLFLTGIIIPFFWFDHRLLGFSPLMQWLGKTSESDYIWSKFVQFLSPIGTGIYFVQRIMHFAHSGVDFCSWDVDWIGIVLHLGIGLAIYWTRIHHFRWK